MLCHNDDSIKAGAALVVMDVAVPLQGKKAACDDIEIVPLLIALLHQFNEHVKAYAAGALMTIAVTTQGKKVREKRVKFYYC